MIKMPALVAGIRGLPACLTVPLAGEIGRAKAWIDGRAPVMANNFV
jgi:hypothetical protein